MDVPFYLKQVNRFLRLAHATEDPEAKADLLAMAHDNLELARQNAALGPKPGRDDAPS